MSKWNESIFRIASEADSKISWAVKGMMVGVAVGSGVGVDVGIGIGVGDGVGDRVGDKVGDGVIGITELVRGFTQAIVKNGIIDRISKTTICFLTFLRYPFGQLFERMA